LASNDEHCSRRDPGLLAGWVFPNGAGKPRANGSLCDANRRVLAHAKIAKRVTIHGLRRTATDLLGRAAVDPVAAKAIISTPSIACGSTTRRGMQSGSAQRCPQLDPSTRV
jgi:integrase